MLKEKLAKLDAQSERRALYKNYLNGLVMVDSLPDVATAFLSLDGITASVIEKGERFIPHQGYVARDVSYEVSSIRLADGEVHSVSMDFDKHGDLYHFHINPHRAPKIANKVDLFVDIITEISEFIKYAILNN